MPRRSDLIVLDLRLFIGSLLLRAPCASMAGRSASSLAVVDPLHHRLPACETVPASRVLNRPYGGAPIFVVATLRLTNAIERVHSRVLRAVSASAKRVRRVARLL